MEKVYSTVIYSPGKQVKYAGQNHIIDHVYIKNDEIKIFLKNIPEPVDPKMVYCPPTLLKYVVKEKVVEKKVPVKPQINYEPVVRTQQDIEEVIKMYESGTHPDCLKFSQEQIDDIITGLYMCICDL